MTTTATSDNGHQGATATTARTATTTTGNMAWRGIKIVGTRDHKSSPLSCHKKLVFLTAIVLLVNTLSIVKNSVLITSSSSFGGVVEYNEFFAPTVMTSTTTIPTGNRINIISNKSATTDTNELEGVRKNTIPSNNTSSLLASGTSYNSNNNNASSSRRRPLVVSKDGKEFTHFFIHIPKAGGAYAFHALSQLFWSNAEMARRPKHKQYRPCNVGGLQLPYFDERYPHDFKGVKCTMWHSESVYDYSMVAQQTYAIVRDPRQQVLSMYFHCTESMEKKSRRQKDMKLGKMATPARLNTWLGMYMDVIDDPYKAVDVFNSLDCPYNPINFQSSYTRFARYGHDNSYYVELLLQASYNSLFTRSGKKQPRSTHTRRFAKSGNSLQRSHTTSRFAPRTGEDQNTKEGDKQMQQRLINGTATIQEEEHAKQDLKNRFDVLGDMAQMDKTVCAILIKYAGFVPDPCNCTTTTTTTSKTEAAAAAEGVVDEYDINKHSHNVKHHGATAKTTPEEDEKIAKLAALDFKLYDVAKEIFAEQVKEIEEEHGIILCDKFRQ